MQISDFSLDYVSHDDDGAVYDYVIESIQDRLYFNPLEFTYDFTWDEFEEDMVEISKRTGESVIRVSFLHGDDKNEMIYFFSDGDVRKEVS